MKMKRFLVIMAMTMLTAGIAAGCGKADTGAEGDKGAFDSSNDITVVSREDGSGTRGAFIELFGVEEEENGEKVDRTTVEANITNSTSVMMSTVAQNEYAVGYISLGSLDDSVKAVNIDGAQATEDTIKSGAYKIQRPFNIVTKDGVSEAAQDFIDFILSAEGQTVVADNHYISLDDVQNYAGSKPSGKISVAGSSSVTPVMEKLKEAYQKVNPGAEIEIQQSDSTTGVTSTADGICDIGMVSRELKDSELSKGVKSTVIATDGIAVVVNKKNPTDELSSEQVKAIYTGDNVTWDEVVK